MIETAHALTSASPSRLHRDRTWAGDLRVSSIEAWPAAGGGLLVGMIVRALSGATPLRQTVKNLFLRIDAQGLSTVIVPYIRLEPEVLRCAADVIAAELRISSGQVVIDNRIAGSRSAASHITDLCPACELGLALLATVARTLLTTAAAELWNIAVSDCVVESGLVLGGSTRRLASTQTWRVMPRFLPCLVSSFLLQVAESRSVTYPSLRLQIAALGRHRQSNARDLGRWAMKKLVLLVSVIASFRMHG